MKVIKYNCIIVYRCGLGIASIYTSQYKGWEPFEVAEHIIRTKKPIKNSVAVCPTKLTHKEYLEFKDDIINDLLETFDD